MGEILNKTGQRNYQTDDSMCGRFTIQYTWAEYHEALSLIPASAKGRNDPPRYNVAPTQNVGFVATDRDGEVVVQDGRWWLVPFWAKEVPKYPMFNARSETATTKSSFREAFKSKRCLIPASSYYEWTKAKNGGKDPHNIHLPYNEPFFFAGLWAHNDTLDITSCTILTAEAAPEIKGFCRKLRRRVNSSYLWTRLSSERSKLLESR